MYSSLYLSICISGLYCGYSLAAPALDGSVGMISARQAPAGPDLHGIYFGDDDSKCDTNQKDIIKQAMWNVRDYAFEAADADKNDPLFHKFFGDGWDGSLLRQVRYGWIRANLRRAGQFPTQGLEGKMDVASRITIRCDDIANRCPGETTGAYTSDGRWYDSNGWYINFCPRFFQRHGHITDRIKQTRTPYLVTLATREHILLHELLHVGVINCPEHIEDVKTNLGGSKPVIAYGPKNCEKLAAKKAPSVLASRNADSYAWYATAIYFRERWNGLDMTTNNPHEELRSERRVDIYGDDEQVVEYDTIPDVPADPPLPPPPPPSRPTLNCNKDCCGFIPDPQWCNANCGGPRC